MTLGELGMSNYTHDSFYVGTQLLQMVLERLEETGVQYCIERNYQGYPHVITGDVDIVVCEGDLGAAVRETQQAAEELEWSPFVVYIAPCVAHIGFYIESYPSRFVLVIEFFVGGVWRGLQFLGANRVIQMRKKHGAFWKPHPAHEAIITLVHHLLYNRRVFEKYRNAIMSLVKESPEMFERELSYSLGLRTARIVTGLVLAGDWNGLECQSKHFRRKFTIRSITLHPLLFAAAVCRGIAGKSKKPEGVVISLDSFKDNYHETLADEIIELAVRWHIFVPPNRRKINFSCYNSVKLIKSTVASGGVAVVLNPSAGSLGLPLTFPIIHVKEQDGEFTVRIGHESERQITKKSASFEIWNTVLKFRSRTIGTVS